MAAARGGRAAGLAAAVYLGCLTAVLAQQPIPESVLSYYDITPQSAASCAEVDAQVAWLQTATQFLACDPGWEGVRCEREVDECDDSPCKNGATCTDMVASFACSCTQGWVGPTCEQQAILGLLHDGVFQYWDPPISPPAV